MTAEGSGGGSTPPPGDGGGVPGDNRGTPTPPVTPGSVPQGETILQRAWREDQERLAREQSGVPTPLPAPVEPRSSLADRLRPRTERAGTPSADVSAVPTSEPDPEVPWVPVPTPAAPTAPAEVTGAEPQPGDSPIAIVPVVPGDTGERSYLDIVREEGSPPPPHGPRRPEGPSGPEGPRGPEWLTSPERGREIVNEIIRLETTMSYTQRYAVRTGPLSETNPTIYQERTGTYLDQLYADLKNYVRGLKAIRNNRDITDPWDQHHVYEEMAHNMTRLAADKAAAGKLEIDPHRELLPAKSVGEIWEEYLNPTAATDLDQVEADLATYFKEGTGLHVLQIGEAIFKGTYNQVARGRLSPEQAQNILKENVVLAKQAVEGFFRTQRNKPEVIGNRAKLAGLGEAYAMRTFDLFEQFLAGEKPNTREGEFIFEEGNELSDEDKESYWRPGHYPKMYEILAKTEGQFRKAADSFLTMITKGSVGKSPDDLYHHFENFKDALGQVGSQQEQAGVVESEFMEDLRVEMEAHGFMFGADYSNETYNPKSYNQFMMAMALHEGPQRWVRLARSGNGGVGAFLWKFDYDPRITLFHNTGGSRGQLLSDTITQHYLQDQIRDIMVEEGMGVVLKDYHPDDIKSIANDPDSIKVFNDPTASVNDQQAAEEMRVKYFKANQERIGRHQTAEKFKGLYEGFDKGDTHKVNFREYGDWTEEQRKRLSTALRRSVIIGKIQTMLEGTEGRGRLALGEIVEKWVHEGRIKPREKRMWEEAYDHAKANFDVAFQMVGASGEKVRRGGGVLFIDRKDAQGHRFVDNMPVYLGEKFVQTAENLCKIQFSNSPAKERTAAVAKARAHAISQIKQVGFEAKLVVPKLKYETDPMKPNFGDVLGKDGDLTETIDFSTAVDSVYSRWTNHTYLGYQQENRHMLTDPDVVAAAKRIRAGISKSEDEDNLATILLIIDPTLKRLKRLEDVDVREGESAMQQEIIIFEAAVEASNIGHWRIDRELNQAFLPSDGNSFKMRTGYNLEDYGGISRFIIRMKQYIGAHPKRFARRYASEIANLPMHVSSMSDQWGQEGIMGAIEMFADPIAGMASQGEASQFAITKFVEQMRLGNMLFEALVGHVDGEQGISIEGLFEKPTNNADKLVEYWNDMKRVKQDPEAENKFFYAILESFGRLQTVLKIVRAMDSDTRNAQGVLDLENTDVFLSDGKINPDIYKDRNSGTSRHAERVFFDQYIKWLLSDKEGGGVQAYGSEARYYKFLGEKYFYVDIDGIKVTDQHKTWADWLFDKMAR